MNITLKKWIAQNGIEYIPIKDSESFEYKPPKMFDSKYAWIWDRESRGQGSIIETNPQYAGITTNLYCNSDGSVRTPNRDRLSDFTGLGIKAKNSVSTKDKFYVNLMEKWGGTNYWHWVTTSLSKLYLLQKLPSFTRFNDYFYLVSGPKERFVVSSLVKFGIDPARCVEIKKQSEAFCSKIILLSSVGDRDIDPVIYLRKSLRKEAVGSDKIYISRSGSRKISNEAEVVDILSKMGFKTVRCEKMSFEEQISTFSSASVIVGPHGAGVTNILFAQNGAKVLEIRNKTYQGNCYLLLCNKLGFDYYNLYGSGNDIKNFSDSDRDLNSNILVDKKDLCNTIEMMNV